MASVLEHVEYVMPVAADGRRLWRLVKDSGVLDLNSAYLYTMMCDYFADTCVLTRTADGEEIGFVMGFIPPAKQDTLFVWQIAVASEHRGKGLGTQMLMELLRRESCQKTRYIEATISPSNHASRAMFHRVAAKLQAVICESYGYRADIFPEEHEAERLCRIGPF